MIEIIITHDNGDGTTSVISLTGIGTNGPLTSDKAFELFPGDTIYIQGGGPDTYFHFGTDGLSIFNDNGPLFEFPNATAAEGVPTTQQIAGEGADTVNCFLAGTHIATPSGETPVERLRVGDAVLTASGTVRPIVWIGVNHRLAQFAHRGPATPIIIRKGALASNVPHRDLRITKGHAVLLDDVLIPAEFLVNHRSILWDDHARSIVVYHLELDVHDVLLAEGAPAESYRDDGNRWLFENANSGWNLPPKPPCRPVLTAGPIVDRVWQHLLDAAAPRPQLPLTENSNLHLNVDGRRVDPLVCAPDFRMFRLHKAPRQVHLISRAAIPQELGIRRDSRSIGVALRRIVIRSAGAWHAINADDGRLKHGFHDYEPEQHLRWTNGDASLPLTLFAGLEGTVDLFVHFACAGARYVDGGQRVA